MSLSRVTGGIGKRLPRSVPPDLVAIVVVASALRLYRLPAESYWLDEATSITYVTTRSLSELLVSLPGSDPHPPLYYVLLYLWSLPFGTSELATRLLSALFGIATVIVLYWIGARLFDRRVGAMAALVLAVSPFHVWYSQETRMYSLLALTTALSFYLFVTINESGGSDGGPSRDEVGYVISTVLLGYTHVFGLFAILAQNLYVFSRPFVRSVPPSRLALRRWVAMQGIVGLLLVPWLLSLFRRVTSASEGRTGNVGWIPTPSAESIWQTFSAYLGGYLLEESMPILVSLLVAGCLMVALSSDDESASEPVQGGSTVNGTYLLVLWLATPIIVPIVLSYLVAPVYVIRYSIGASLAFLLLLAKGVRMFSFPPMQYVVVGILVVGLVLPLPAYYEDDQKEQWREAAAHIESNADGGDVVLVSQTFAMKPFGYYFDRSDVTVVPVDPDASTDEVRNHVRGHGDVWIVFSHTSSSTEQRIMEAVEGHSEYRGPVESEGYIRIEVHRFERTGGS